MGDEPDFKNEKELENAIASALRIALDTDGLPFVVLQGFGLDLAVFRKRADLSRMCFFEVKAFSEHHNRCGFGNQRGEGNQIRLLFDEVAQLPRDPFQLGAFDSTVRWVVGNRSQSIGSRRYLIFTCAQAQDAAMGGVRAGKQNNLRLSEFKNCWITWQQLLEVVINFARLSR